MTIRLKFLPGLDLVIYVVIVNTLTGFMAGVSEADSITEVLCLLPYRARG